MNVKQLRNYIREVLQSASGDGPYTHALVDDDAISGKSILVPDDIKKKIKDYFNKMGLSRHKSKKRRV